MRYLLTVPVIAMFLGPALPAQIRVNKNSPKLEETTRIVNDCEQRTNKFKKTIDKALARDNVRAGQAREDQINRDAERLENQMDKVGDSWNRDHDYNKTRGHVSAAIATSQSINTAMRNWSMGGDAESEWNAVRGELNRLAQTFGLPKIRW